MRSSLLILVLVTFLFQACNHNSKDFLSLQEKQWLSQNKGRFNSIFGYDVPPNAFYNEDKEYVGILVDFQKEIEKDLDYQFNFYNVSTWDSLIQYAKKEQDFIIIGIARTKEREEYLQFTNSIVTVPFVIITRKDAKVNSMQELIGKKVCSLQNYAVNEYLAEYHPRLDIIEVGENIDGLRGVSSGTYDAMIISQMYGSYLIEKQGITNLRIAGESGYTNRLSVAVSRKNPVLFQVMDKAINNISTQTQRDIKSHWIYATSNRIPPKTIRIVVMIVVIVVAIILLLWVWLIMLRRQVEHKTKIIMEGESKYRTLVENSYDAIFLQFEGHFVSVNRKFESLFGYTHEEILDPDFSIFKITARESKDLIAERLDNIQNNKKIPLKYEFTGITKEHKHLFLEVSVSYIKHNNGYATQGIIHDVTERKIRENELILAKQRAEESDKLKSAFLANMSHEIRTPMNGILGFAELLNMPSLSPENQLEYIKIINQSGKRMLNTVNDLINISKLETGLVTVQNTEFDLNEKLIGLINFFRQNATKKGIHLSRVLPHQGNVVLLNTDETKFESIVSNFIGNAIKFTEKGSVELVCEITAEEILISVKDTGIGIPKNRINAIFNRFEQADISDKKALEGFGLGLAISKSYSEMIGGKIWVESIENVGSTFYFSLKTNIIKNQGVVERIKTQVQNGGVLRKLKILIIEDDEASAQYLIDILDPFGCEKHYAKNGEEGLRLYNENPDLDVVLLDIKLPVMSGYQVYEEIRKLNSNVIIIAQTAFAMQSDYEKAMSLGFNNYIAKPIEKDMFIQMLIETVKQETLV